jgi:hypothetical protein
MAAISLTRTSEYVNMAREYGIYIDDKKAGTISHGQTKNFAVAPGAHTMYAKIDWCYSPARSFTVGPSENTSFKVGGFKYANRIMLFSAIIIALSFILHTTIHFNYLIWLLFPSFLFMVYITSFGRKKYLTLSYLGSVDKIIL